MAVEDMLAGRWVLASMVSKGVACDGKPDAQEPKQEPTYPMGRGCCGSLHYDPKNSWMHAILETDPALVPTGFKSPTITRFVVVSSLIWCVSVSGISESGRRAL
jgi:hypothetical protein